MYLKITIVLCIQKKKDFQPEAGESPVSSQTQPTCVNFQAGCEYFPAVLRRNMTYFGMSEQNTSHTQELSLARREVLAVF